MPNTEETHTVSPKHVFFQTIGDSFQIMYSPFCYLEILLSSRILSACPTWPNVLDHGPPMGPHSLGHSVLLVP